MDRTEERGKLTPRDGENKDTIRRNMKTIEEKDGTTQKERKTVNRTRKENSKNMRRGNRRKKRKDEKDNKMINQ